MTSGAWPGFRLAAQLLRRSFWQLNMLVSAPLFTLIFLAITRHAGRPDLASYAVLAPALIVLWRVALVIAGEIIDRDRANGALELLVAAPARFAGVVTGQIGAVVLLGLAGFGESWLAAWLGFGVLVPIRHPAAFLATLVATALAMAGTASMMSALFVLTRSARAFTNSLSYPFYILGGVMVPVSFLPGWLEPVSRVVFLSWSSDLLRDALSPRGVPDLLPRLGVVLLLGLAGYAAGLALQRRAVDRLRRTGAVGHA